MKLLHSNAHKSNQSYISHREPNLVLLVYSNQRKSIQRLHQPSGTESNKAGLFKTIQNASYTSAFGHTEHKTCCHSGRGSHPETNMLKVRQFCRKCTSDRSMKGTLSLNMSTKQNNWRKKAVAMSSCIHLGPIESHTKHNRSANGLIGVKGRSVMDLQKTLRLF